jgi:hypothetical protein
MSERFDASVRAFLLDDPSDEEITFATWYPAVGRTRFTSLLHTAIFPHEGDRVRHGNVSALPLYVDRAKETARVERSGLAMMHTHPLGTGWQRLSGPDEYYEKDILSREIYGVTGFPFVGLTLAGDGKWSARIYPKEPGKAPSLEWCNAVRIVGRNLTVQFNERLKPPIRPGKALLRTTSVWGDAKQADIMKMRVGIIGAGSVGEVVAETLSRIGVGEIYVVDYDRVRVHNLDRLLYARKGDVGKSKAELTRTRAVESATNSAFTCHSFPRYSVVEDDGFEVAKDCDVLFSCVDRPWPRQVLNHLAYSSLIPVIDGGVSFRLVGSRLIHGMFRAQTVGPERVCMNCLGAYDSAEVQMDREGRFDDPEYVEEWEKAGTMPSRQNIMPFTIGLASLETIQFAELVTDLGRKGDLGQQAYDYHTGELLPAHSRCRDDCEYMALVARGDSIKPFLGHDVSKGRSLDTLTGGRFRKTRKVRGKREY